jgi:imidazolonepropionase-like amidohydrolase
MARTQTPSTNRVNYTPVFASALFAASVAATVLVARSAVAQQSVRANGADSAGVYAPKVAMRYTLWRAGQPSGQMATWWAKKNTLESISREQYLTSINGRSTTVTLDHHLLPIAERFSISSPFTIPLVDQLDRRGGFAIWRSRSGSDSVAVGAQAFYLPPAVDPLQLALLARAGHALGGDVRLLPSGIAHVEIVDHARVTKDALVEDVTLFSISGIDYQPRYVWLDSRGELFEAATTPTPLREGWEEVFPLLIAAERHARAVRVSAIAVRLAHRSSAVVFHDVAVFNAIDASVLPHRDVVVSDSIITAVQPTSSRSWPSGTTIFEGNGKMLIPGLWDMHTHVTENTGMLDLAAGVTTVRDLGNDTTELLARRKRIEQGTELGTRIVLAGLIDSADPAHGPGVLVRDAFEARAAVDRYADLGYVQIKIYNFIPPALVPVIILEAHRRGLRVSGHVPQTMTASECVQLGFDELQHIGTILVNFQPDAHARRTLASGFADYARSEHLDVHSPEVQSFVQLLLSHHTAVDPTLTRMEDIMLGDTSSVSPTFAAVEARLPALVRRGLPRGLSLPQDQRDQMRRAFPVMLALVKVMYDAGVPIEVGTDEYAGFTLDRELELDVQAGIPAASALQMATLGAASIMHLDTTVGSITPGKLADLALIDGDATQSISNVRSVIVSVRNGVVYKPAELYRELSIIP